MIVLRFSWFKLGYSSVFGFIIEIIVIGERSEYLVIVLEFDLFYRVCMVFMEISNFYLFDEIFVCIEIEIVFFRMYNFIIIFNRE